MARTILVECAWASLRYNPWAKSVYDRICGKQKTGKKKAAIALARKIAVLAWALLRDEKNWDPIQMLGVTESFGVVSQDLKETLYNMKPKENSDQRKSRLRREARQAKVADVTSSTSKTDKKLASKSTPATMDPTKKSKPKGILAKPTAKPNIKTAPEERVTTTSSKPRRARKLVSGV